MLKVSGIFLKYFGGNESVRVSQILCNRTNRAELRRRSMDDDIEGDWDSQDDGVSEELKDIEKDIETVWEGNEDRWLWLRPPGDGSDVIEWLVDRFNLPPLDDHMDINQGTPFHLMSFERTSSRFGCRGGCPATRRR
tara:strand:- start:3925 stop:4335 length:411 start_codon:yes stop_codon:yes gene_type:complete